MHENIKIFHAGTAKINQRFTVSGGRVLCVSALADDIAAARQKVYGALEQISFEHMHYRTDIGEKALVRIAQNT